MKYKRILLKLSGEGLANKEKKLAVDYELIQDYARQLKIIKDQGIQVAIVVGGGNFWRGASASKNGIKRFRADYIGMLATVMNALALQSGFEEYGLKSRVQSAVNIDPKVCENYINEKALKYLKAGEIVIFAGGTGRPFFTTDTAATLSASELGCDVILMGKNGVDGIYDSDPKINKGAKHFPEITYNQVISDNLTVMDSTSAVMARDNNIPSIVFDITKKDSLINTINNDNKNTKVN